MQTIERTTKHAAYRTIYIIFLDYEKSQVKNNELPKMCLYDLI